MQFWGPESLHSTSHTFYFVGLKQADQDKHKMAGTAVKRQQYSILRVLFKLAVNNARDSG